MKIVTELNELAGKTIKHAKNVDYDEMLALVFTDDTYAVIKARYRYDQMEIELEDNVEDHVKKEAGVITKDEYEELRRIKTQKAKEEIIKRDLQTLERLQQQYPTEEVK